MKNFFIKLLILFLTTTPLASLAFTPTINMMVTPANPGPNEEVTVALASYSIDLDSAKIVWSLNGKDSASGTGQKTFSFNTGGVGGKHTVTANIETAKGEKATKTVAISVADIDLIWEAGTYTPPFYRGKALVASEAPITVVAIPHLVNGKGEEIKAENLVYNWKKNGKALPAYSGYGKNSASVFADKTGRTTVSVAVSQAGDDLSMGSEQAAGTEKSLEIPVSAPRIVFYENKPLEGAMYGRALKKASLLIGDLPVKAEPYFFSLRDLGSLSYNWTIGTKPFEARGDKRYLTFQKTDESDAENVISLSIQDPISLLQEAVASFTISSVQKASNF